MGSDPILRRRLSHAFVVYCRMKEKLGKRRIAAIVACQFAMLKWARGAVDKSCLRCWNGVIDFAVWGFEITTLDGDKSHHHTSFARGHLAPFDTLQVQVDLMN